MSLLKTTKLTIRRWAEPVNINGVLTNPDTPEERICYGSLQPAKESELKNFPDLNASDGILRFFTRSKLIFAEGKQDETILDGVRYIVFAGESWNNNIVNYNKYLLRRTE